MIYSIQAVRGSRGRCGIWIYTYGQGRMSSFYYRRAAAIWFYQVSHEIVDRSDRVIA